MYYFSLKDLFKNFIIREYAREMFYPKIFYLFNDINRHTDSLLLDL